MRILFMKKHIFPLNSTKKKSVSMNTFSVFNVV